MKKCAESWEIVLKLKKYPESWDSMRKCANDEKVCLKFRK